MRSIRKHIDQFFFAPSLDHRPLAFLRIGLGLVLLMQALHLRHDFIDFIGSKGIVLSDITQVELPIYALTTHSITSFFANIWGMEELQILYLIGGLYIFALFMMTIGLGTRWSAALAWLLHLSLIKGAHIFSYGVDYIATSLLFYCILFPVGRLYSLDAKLFNPKLGNVRPYLRIIQLHLCFIYFVGGFMKAIGINWWNGEAIWKAIQRPVMVEMPTNWLADFPYLLAFIGISVVILEVFYPLCIWYKRTQASWMWATVAMHIGIAILLNLPFFAAVMAIFNIAAFHFEADKVVVYENRHESVALDNAA